MRWENTETVKILKIVKKRVYKWMNFSVSGAIIYASPCSPVLTQFEIHHFDKFSLYDPEI